MTKMRKCITKALAVISTSIIASLFFAQSANAIPISAGFVGTSGAQGQLGMFAQDMNFEYGNSKKIPGADLKYTLNYSLIAGAYQATRNTAFALLVPYLDSYFRGTLPVAPGVFFPVSITKKGLGDPTLAWRYTFYRTNGLGWVSAWTVNAALGLPLGSYDDVTVPRALQPGTGNFVPTVGGNYYFDSASYGTFVFNLSYANPLERNGYRFPSTFNYNLAFAYPIYPNGKLMPGRVYPFVPYLHLEFLGTRTGQQHATNQFANGSNANTGGNLIRCAPAISFDMLGWSVAAQYMFPISQSLHGVQPIEFDRAFLVLFGFEMAGLG